jgi:hypothetical protein
MLQYNQRRKKWSKLITYLLAQSHWLCNRWERGLRQLKTYILRNHLGLRKMTVEIPPAFNSMIFQMRFLLFVIVYINNPKEVYRKSTIISKSSISKHLKNKCKKMLFQMHLNSTSNIKIIRLCSDLQWCKIQGIIARTQWWGADTAGLIQWSSITRQTKISIASKEVLILMNLKWIQTSQMSQK